MAISKIRDSPLFTLVIILILIPFSTVVYLTDRPVKYEAEFSLQDELNQLSKRLREVETTNSDRMADVMALRHDVQRVLQQEKPIVKSPIASFYRNNSVHVGRETLGQKHVPSSGDVPSTSSRDIQMPSLKDFLPHLNYFNGLKPSYKLSAGRFDVTLVLGIPTVERPVPGYLISTLQNLIDNMDEKEKQDVIIIVCIAEEDKDYVESEGDRIKEEFQTYIESGLLEVISPPEGYYPDFEKLKITLGDTAERVRWRTKQNLDYAYLMMYAKSKGTFYVQLEDDILTKPHYVTTMKNFAFKQLRQKKDWIVLDFCQLGFIGKLFRAVDLPKLVTFFAIFHGDKPVDWLLDHMVQTKMCRFDRKDCRKQKDSVWIHYRPSLFQHVGTHSSLKGKVQKLKDKQFGKTSVHYPHRNPPAMLKTSLKVYRSYNLQRAYKGDSFFWSRSATKDDNITLYFSPPVLLERYYFRSGNSDYPDAILYNASVQIRTASSPRIPELIPYPRTDDNYLVLGNFHENAGVAEGSVVPTVGPVSILRIQLEEDSDNWIILSEIAIETSPAELAMSSVFNGTTATGISARMTKS